MRGEGFSTICLWRLADEFGEIEKVSEEKTTDIGNGVGGSTWRVLQ